MAREEKTISELTSLATVNRSEDLIPVIDVSDTTDSEYGTTKKTLVEQFVGDKGDAATVDVGTTTTLSAGSDATVSNSGSTSAAVLDFGIPRGRQGTQGIQGVAGADGTDGANAYVYIAYASDASGTGFTLTFNASLDYIAIKATTTEIASPVASDFTGLWKNYKGAQGIQGIQGIQGVAGADGTEGTDGVNAYVYIAYASDNSGTGFTTTFDANLDYVAIKTTTTEIVTPQASDFTGLWKNYRGATGSQGVQGGPGADGDSAYVYIAYASDASGTGFTTTFNAALDYIAVKATTTEITTPQASDFTGLWKNYKGATGAQGIQGIQGVAGAGGTDGTDGVNAYVYIAYASDASGTDFTMTFNALLDYVAIKATTTEIVSPTASDFTGLWKNYKGATGETGATGSAGADGLDINWLGVYNAGTGYVVNDAVFYLGSSYICKLASTGSLPTNTTYWDLMAQQGAAGVGSGDVSGPASATDNAIARFDLTTGKLIQDSLVTVSDDGDVNIPAGRSYLVNGSPVEGYSDEQAQDAVGTILTDSSEIDFTYTDATPSITAAIKEGSIDETKLDVSTNASLDLADSAVQSLSTSTGTNLTGFLKGNGTNLLANTSAVVAGTCTTARTTAAKTVSISDYTLTTGDILAITFTDGFSVNNATLAVNGGSAINIRVGAVNVTTALISVAAATSFTLPLYYDGTYFYAFGNHLNTNTTYSEISEAEITAGTASTARTITGRRAEFLAASIKSRTETLTNKTLTSPVINTGVSGTAVLDEDDMASNSATKLATQQSIKAYVDAKGFTWEGPWATLTPYDLNDTVESNGSGYVCTSAHTSGATTEPGVGVFWTSYWDLFVESGATGPTGPNSVTTSTTTNLTGYLKGSGGNVAVESEATLLGKIYPIGSIYTNATDNTNPATLLGFGTWIAFGAGRVPVGYDSGTPAFNTAEKTGGSAEVTLTGNQSGTSVHNHGDTGDNNRTHNHTQDGHYHVVVGSNGGSPTVCFNQYSGGGTGNWGTGGNIGITDTATPSIGDNNRTHTHTVSNSTAANATTAHTNLQPYITVYMWKRTA